MIIKLVINDGVPIPICSRNQYANEIYEYLINNPEEPSYYIRIGNSMVIGIRHDSEPNTVYTLK